LLAHHPQWPPREAGQQLHAKLEAQPPALDSQPPAGKNPTTMLQAQLLASFLQSSAAQAPPGGAPVSLPLQLLQAEQLLHAEQMRVHEHHQQQEHLAQQQQQQAHALQQHLLRQAQHQQLLQQLVETQAAPWRHPELLLGAPCGSPPRYPPGPHSGPGHQPPAVTSPGLDQSGSPLPRRSGSLPDDVAAATDRTGSGRSGKSEDGGGDMSPVPSHVVLKFVASKSETSNGPRKFRLQWTDDLHHCFMRAMSSLGGIHKATAAQILDQMDVPNLTLRHVKSHLQQLRLHIGRDSSAGIHKDRCGVVAEKRSLRHTRPPPRRRYPKAGSDSPPQPQAPARSVEAAPPGALDAAAAAAAAAMPGVLHLMDQQEQLLVELEHTAQVQADIRRRLRENKRRLEETLDPHRTSRPAPCTASP